MPSFSYVTVDANSLIISTFRTDTMQLIDVYDMKKLGPPGPMPVPMPMGHQIGRYLSPKRLVKKNESSRG